MKIFFCPRKLDGQEIKVSYIDYHPYYSPGENPKQPSGIVMEALRILSSKKNAQVEFSFNPQWNAFNPETGEWHLGCVRIRLIEGCCTSSHIDITKSKSFF